MITSRHNEKVRLVRELSDSARARKETGLFPAEGIRLVREIPRDQIESVFVQESKEAAAAPDLTVPYELVSDDAFTAMSDTKNPQGVLALVRRNVIKPEELAGRENAVLMILEHLQDPGNLGTIIRCAEGAGITGIICSADTVDVTNPKVVRSTMGSIFRVPVSVAEDSFTDVLSMLHRHDFRLFAAHLAGTCDYDEVSYPSRTGILIGNEANGLTAETAQAADQLVRIPMEGRVESLNAAVAASVFMYEIYRQKRAAARTGNRQSE